MTHRLTPLALLLSGCIFSGGAGGELAPDGAQPDAIDRDATAGDLAIADASDVRNDPDATGVDIGLPDVVVPPPDMSPPPDMPPPPDGSRPDLPAMDGGICPQPSPQQMQLCGDGSNGLFDSCGSRLRDGCAVPDDCGTCGDFDATCTAPPDRNGLCVRHVATESAAAEIRALSVWGDWYVVTHDDSTPPQAGVLSSGAPETIDFYGGTTRSADFGASAAIVTDTSGDPLVIIGDPGKRSNDGSLFSWNYSVNFNADQLLEADSVAAQTGDPLFNATQARLGVSLSIGRRGGVPVGVVGAPGAAAAVTFSETNNAWRFDHVLRDPNSGGPLSGFGTKVDSSREGQVIAVAAPADNRVVVFRWSGTDWSVDGVLTPSGTRYGDFGAALAVSESGDQIAVGRPVAGDILAFQHDGAGWVPVAPIAAPPNAPGNFPTGLALIRKELVFAARVAANRAYPFVLVGTNSFPLGVFEPPAGASGFGGQIERTTNRLVVSTDTPPALMIYSVPSQN